MSQAEFYRLAHLCGCGSGLVSSWYKDERGNDVRACEACRVALLRGIFEDRYLDLFQDWLGTLFSPEPALGHEWVWEDLLKEKGCEQVVGLEEAKRKRDGRIMISCPNGDSLQPRHSVLDDRSVHILVPVDYAERVLCEGRMV